MSTTPKAPIEIAEARIREARDKQSEELDLSGLNLKRLPDSIWQLVHLHRLDLCNNKFEEFPQDFGRFRSLQTLHLRGNGFRLIPDGVQTLSQLKLLDVQNNRLELVPQWIHQLGSLEMLWLNNNVISEVPDEIGALSNLHTLNAWNNRISRLPPTIGKLSKLKELSIWENRLAKLPDEIGDLAELTELAIGQNLLVDLPKSLFRLSKLEKLWLHGNNSLEIPSELLGPTWDEVRQRGISPAAPSRLLEYYFRVRQGSRPLNEAKLILVGRGSVGKTTVVHQLVHDKFVQKTKTKGIKVSLWSVPSGQGDIATHVWDFGGQEIMHGTHQFFLTERSLYLLVLAGREDREDEDAEYWLKTIRAFGGESPVIVVLNKIKEHHFEVDEEGLREKYPNIVDFIETDCRPPRKGGGAYGVTRLRKKVIAEIARMESVRKAFPSAWFEIKQRLTDMHENFMQFEAFRKICDEHGAANAKDQEELAHYLHLLGVALNYRDDPRLSETSVLNPKWVTTGIYRILNDSLVRKKRGLLRPGDLARILSDVDYPLDMHDFLLRLMKKFELCFPLDEEGKGHLVPELLGKKQPKLADEFEISKCLCFEYHYGSLLPEGLLPRFIVRAYTRIESELLWRTGVVLGWKGARALVKSDEHDRVVLIRVHGEPHADAKHGPERFSLAARELLSLVRQHFDAIHRNFKHLDPVEKIRVPHEERILVEYSKIEAFAEVRQSRFLEVVGSTFVHLDARQLLAEFEVPGARMGAAARGASQSYELPLGLSVVRKHKRR